MSSPESTGKFKREMEGQFPGRSIGQPVIPQAPTDFTKVNRRKRCGECPACKIKENCNVCKNCINRKILKQTCVLRRCHFLHHKSNTSNSSADGIGKRKRNENKNSASKKCSEDSMESMKVVPVTNIQEEEEPKIEEPVEPDISSSDEIEQAVNSLLEDSSKYADFEETSVPDKVVVPPRTFIPKMLKRSDSSSMVSYNRNYNAKSFPGSSEVLKSSSLLNKQNESSFFGSGVSFKINPTTSTHQPQLNGVTPAIPVPPGQHHPTAYQIPGHPMQGSVMIMNPPTLPKTYNSEIPRQNIVFTRLPPSSGIMFQPRNGPLSSEEIFQSNAKMTENQSQFQGHSTTLFPPQITSGSFGNDFNTPKVHRRKRCGQCHPCQIKENCMKCKNCLNRKVLKQTCIHRKCLFLREKMRKESGFCSSPIVDSQPVQQSQPPAQPQQQFMGQIYDSNNNISSHSQQTQLQPAVFIAEHYDQPQFRPVLHQNQKPAEISISGPVNIIPQGHVIQHGQHIQVFQNPYPGAPFPQGIPMIATPQGNYTLQVRHQHQLGGYVQAHMLNPSDQIPRYYMHPAGHAIAHVKSIPEFASMNRLPSMNARPIAFPPIPVKVEITPPKESGDKPSIECKDATPSSSQ